MTDSKFYVELPADQHGNTGYSPAVIEAVAETVEYGVRLNVLGPVEFASKWPTVMLNIYGGWAETEGPARELTVEGHRDLVASLPQAVKDATPSGMVTLKNGDVQMRPLVNALMMTLQGLIGEDPLSFYEIVMTCREPNHVVWNPSRQKLLDLLLVEVIDEDGHAHVHSVTRSIVLSATEGEELELKLTSPIAA